MINANKHKIIENFKTIAILSVLSLFNSIDIRRFINQIILIDLCTTNMFFAKFTIRNSKHFALKHQYMRLF